MKKVNTGLLFTPAPNTIMVIDCFELLEVIAKSGIVMKLIEILQNIVVQRQ